MFRFGRSAQAQSQSKVVVNRPDEEWQDWMDWSRTSETNEPQHLEITPRTSSESAHQLPSPQASITSEFPSYSKKRKVSDESNAPPDDLGLDKRTGHKSTAQNKSHSLVEKRYRTNLNHKIAELGECIPVLKGGEGAQDEGEEAVSMLKHKKETVLVEAIAYIRKLELRNRHLEQANQTLQEWRLAHESSTAVIHDSSAKDQESVEVALPSTSSSTADECDDSQDALQIAAAEERAPTRAPQGMIKVPDEWKRMWRGEFTSHISSTARPASRTEDPAASSVELPGKKHLGRLMLGSIAGIMLLDGISSSTENGRGDRGLFALPALPSEWRSLFDDTSWLFTDNLQSLPQSALFLPLARAFLLFGILGLLLFIYLFNSKPPSRKPSISTFTSNHQPQPSPSVASPLEVRQRAFLTAIQTIWFPTHRVLPEMLALNIETAAYLVRQLLGWRTYSWITGRSEEQEVARVRAWNIAIDAQLSGGDLEVSKSRLVLSLWASGTLPNSPAVLMLKALHIRILFWQPSRWPWLTRRLHCVARRLAHWQWAKCQKLLDTVHSKPDPEPLSEHLKALLAQPDEDVMTDDTIRRAHNLAWNTAGLQRSCSESMCEDTAMRGPLDAVAVWYSTDTLTRVLESIAQNRDMAIDDSTLCQLSTAVSTSPTASLGKARALAATSVFDERRRQSALEQLTHQLSSSNVAALDMAGNKIESTIQAILDDLADSEYGDIKTCVAVAFALSDSDSSKGFDEGRKRKVSRCTTKSSGLLAWASVHHLLQTLRPTSTEQSMSSMSDLLTKSLLESASLDTETKARIDQTLTEYKRR